MKLNSIKILIFTLFFLQTINLSAQQKTKAFLCAYMDGKAEDLRYFVSSDGYHFTNVNDGKSILKSTVGGKILRDPHIIQDKKGVYHLIATNAWKGRTFSIWDSNDLIEWKNERAIEVSPLDADKTWAPEAIYNEQDKNYVFYWTSSLADNNKSWSIYYATTKDFQHFSKPKILMRSGGIILDANIVKYSNKKYYMFYRYENKIWRKTSDRLLGDYRDSTIVIDANVEGPFVYKTSAKKWNMIWDYYGGNQGKYGMAESVNLIDWKWLTDKNPPYYNSNVSFPDGARHGSVIAISTFQMDAILKKYPNNSAR
ncbi:glycoside hydrolase family 43 protein [Pedobacter rhodius]|uniref:Glycoside hydrolase family 43 protein n=1 Tax=Pedobacter rhodius TaxID=3004098 RepID=A0ABT4KV81_9SPHI|nr:glycoside hydrolase family 43 protein [Pedobacter sp. SJ11]MCZ4222152.1 glycoside hydrolase family 43 protein [Pedobacter sp. SJ11]